MDHLFIVLDCSKDKRYYCCCTSEQRVREEIVSRLAMGHKAEDIRVRKLGSINLHWEELKVETTIHFNPSRELSSEC